jgi:hypothetical protein
MIYHAIERSEDLFLTFQTTLVSRESLADFSRNFTEPEGPDSRHDPPTRELFKARQLSALPWGFLPYNVSRCEQRPAPGLPHPTVLRLQAFSTS